MSPRPDREESAQLQYETEHTDPGRGKAVVPYMIILIAAAFLLLGMAWLMQLRTEQSVQGLNESVNTIRTVDQLVDDNRRLHDEVAQLRDQLSALEDEKDALDTRLKASQERVSQLQSELSITRQQLAQATEEAP